MKNNISHTVAFFPILQALRELNAAGVADSFIGNTPEHDSLLSMLPLIDGFRPFPEEQLKTFIAKDVERINAFLKSRVFDIQLSAPLDLGIVVIMDLLGTWMKPGNEATITRNNQPYPAVRLEDCTVLQTSDHGQIIRIETKEGFTVHIQPHAEERSGNLLFEHIIKVQSANTTNNESCTVTVPLVLMNEQPDVSWVAGIQTVGSDPLTITQVLQQNKLALTTNGIRAQSAVAMALRKGISMDKRIIINEPFNLWITHKNQVLPLFGAYIAPDTWKNPEA
ncbi:MAG: hypothetical protein WCG20_03175 [bacterium]